MTDVNNIGYTGPNASGVNLPSLGQGIGAANSALGIVNGLSRGGVVGDAGAALSAGNLYNQLYGTNNAAAIPGLGTAAPILGLVNGIKQGGVMGDTNAALSAATLAGQAANAGLLGSGALSSGASAAGAAAGAVAVPLAAFAGLYALGNYISAHDPLNGNSYAANKAEFDAINNDFAKVGHPLVAGGGNLNATPGQPFNYNAWAQQQANQTALATAEIQAQADIQNNRTGSFTSQMIAALQNAGLSLQDIYAPLGNGKVAPSGGSIAGLKTLQR